MSIFEQVANGCSLSKKEVVFEVIYLFLWCPLLFAYVYLQMINIIKLVHHKIYDSISVI